MVLHRRYRGRRTRSCREQGLAAMQSLLDLDVPEPSPSQGICLRRSLCCPARSFVVSVRIVSSVRARGRSGRTIEDQQQHVHGPQVPSSANIPSSSPSCRRLRIYSRAWFCSGSVVWCGVVEQEQRPQTHKGHQALGLSRDARQAYTPSTIICELSRILSMGKDILFLARDLACAAKMAVQGGRVGGFGPRSPANDHFVKIVCCVQQSTSLEQGLCLRLLCRGAPCRCLCLSCGSVCPCEHGLRFLKSSTLRWQSRSIRTMA
jgi:hypothetical protein